MALSGVRQEYFYMCVQKMHEEGYAITETCDILNLNRSSYYKWAHRTKSSSELENEALLHDIGFDSTPNTTEPMATAELRTSTTLPMKNSTT